VTEQPYHLPHVISTLGEILYAMHSTATCVKVQDLSLSFEMTYWEIKAVHKGTRGTRAPALGV
jgi:hypothetical protein